MRLPGVEPMTTDHKASTALICRLVSYKMDDNQSIMRVSYKPRKSAIKEISRTLFYQRYDRWNKIWNDDRIEKSL